MVRLAYLREHPFDLITARQMPLLCARLKEALEEDTAREVVATLYLQTVFVLSGYTNIERIRRIEGQRRSLLQGVSLSASPRRDCSKTERKECVDAMWSVRRNYLKEDWAAAERRGHKRVVADGIEIRVFIDPGTWSDHPELFVWLLGKTLSPIRLFGVDFPGYLEYQRPEAFRRHFESTMELISKFVDGVHREWITQRGRR